MEIPIPQPHRRVGALVVTAAVLLALGAAGGADAQGVAAGAMGIEPLPEAGWHGRPIREPQKAVPAPLSKAYAGHKPSVRQVQRMLIEMGYVPGPADGVYGPRTRSSVQWFQIKHGLRPSGLVDAATLNVLRSTPAREPAATPADIEKPSPATARPARRAAHIAQPAQQRVSAALVALVVALAAAALALACIAVARWRRAAAAGATELQASGPPRAIGFAGGRDRDELNRHADAIQRACHQRGWTLTCLVRGEAARRQRAVSFALDQAQRESAPRLVVSKVGHLGRSPREVSALLALCARRKIAVIALDAGFDTSTNEGLASARRALAEAAAQDRNRRQPRRGPARRPPAGDVGLSSSGGNSA